MARQMSVQHKPIQVRAEVLARMEALSTNPLWTALMASSGDAEPEEPLDETGWHDSDLKRAIEVAEEAGLKSYRVEIAPDGTISIIVGTPAA